MGIFGVCVFKIHCIRVFKELIKILLKLCFLHLAIYFLHLTYIL